MCFIRVIGCPKKHENVDDELKLTVQDGSGGLRVVYPSPVKKNLKKLTTQYVDRISQLRSEPEYTLLRMTCDVATKAAQNLCHELIHALNIAGFDMKAVSSYGYENGRFLFNAKHGGDIKLLKYKKSDPTKLIGLGTTSPPEPKGHEIKLQASQYFATTSEHGPIFINKRRFGKGAGILNRGRRN